MYTYTCSFILLITECSDGSYGEECKYQCGECLNVITCDNVNGKCSEGCKPGWQSTYKCDIRMFELQWFIY